MAESDFLSYSSIYETFSKGPKSIYYGVGDEMLPGAILNVPQNDEDDEWGRTQRISEERTYDFIAKIYKTLFDPYNSLADISLTPGEAGSEINVAKNIIRLVGRAGIDIGVFDLSIPSMVLGDVVINGADNNILIGSGFEATETSLKLNTFFEFDGNTESGKYGSATFKNVSTNWYDYSGVIKFTIIVNGKEYFYGVETGTGDPLLELPVGGVLHVRGTSKVNGILPNADISYDIGSTALRFKNIYSENVTATNLNTSYNYSSFLMPPTDGSELKIGHPSNNDTITINAGSFYLYDVSTSIPSISIFEDGSINYLKIGDASGSYAVSIRAHDSHGFKVYTPNDPVNPVFGLDMDTIWMNRIVIPGSEVDIGDEDNQIRNVWAGNIFLGTGTVCGPLSSSNIFPRTTVTYDLGSNSLRYDKIYSTLLNVTSGLYSDSLNEWNVCGPNMKIRVYGDVKIGVCAAYIEMYEPLFTKSIYPLVPLGNFIGSLTSGGYEAIYLRDQTTGAPIRVYVDSGVLHP